jgi:hypothetical protein
MESYTGKVYDLDFTQGNDWCQALIIKKGETINIVVVTSDIRIQSILETAMIMGHDVEVEYKPDSPNVLTRAKLNLP